MVKVTKDGMTMAVRDNNQLAAFLNNGWKKVAEEKLVKNHEDVSGNDSAEETQKNDQSAVAEPPKHGRKPTRK